MDRITKKQLQYLVDCINTLTGSPMTPYSKNDKGGYSANIGNYHIDYAYGGVALERMMNNGGGVRQILNTGHVPRRELYNALRAYLAGLEQRDDKAAVLAEALKDARG